jgi:hypothetical protein
MTPAMRVGAPATSVVAHTIGAFDIKKRKRAGTHIIDVVVAAAFSMARVKEPIAIAASTPMPNFWKPTGARKSPRVGSKKKKHVHCIGLPHVAPPLGFVDALHDNYSGADNMFADTAIRYEIQTYPDSVAGFVCFT